MNQESAFLEILLYNVLTRLALLKFYIVVIWSLIKKLYSTNHIYMYEGGKNLVYTPIYSVPVNLSSVCAR